MRIIKSFTKVIINFFKSFKLRLKGIIFFSLLFILGNILNSGFSYMGNSSSDLTYSIIKIFWPVILFQIIKVLIVYIALGYIFDLIYGYALDYINSRRERNIRHRYIYLFLFLSFISIFLWSIINNPQLYVDNFSSKFYFLNRFHNIMTDYFSPWIFLIIFFVINITALTLAILSVINNISKKNNYFSKDVIRFFKNFDYKNRRFQLSAVLFFVLIIAIVNIKLAPQSDKKNIIIISSDAVRPDRLSGNGYFRETTPNIDRYLEKNLQFMGVTTTVPRTFPAWISILTSSTPLYNEISHMFPRTRERSEKIPAASDYLKGLGYYTSVVSEFAGDIFPRIDLGFDKVLAPDMNFNVIVKQVILEKQVFLLPYILNSFGRYIFSEIRDIAKFSDPNMLTNETIDQIKSAGGKPFFISVFYSITHFPYAASYPYYKEYVKKDYKGPYKYFKQVQIKIGDEEDKVGDEFTERDKEQIQALYDGCLKEFDHEVGRILSYLEKNGLMKNTIVVITSDHGENLYEYEYGLGHGEHLKGDFALEVPFIIIADNLLPEQRGKVIEMRSSNIDIMPTIFELAEIEMPGFFNGASLFNPEKRIVDAYCETGIWFDNNKSSDLFFYHNRIDYPDISSLLDVDFNYRRETVIKQEFQNIIVGAKYRAIYSGDYKLIYIPLKSGVKFELYNIKTDKDNRYNLADKNVDVLKDMKKKFYDYIEKESSGNMLKVGDYVLPIFSYPVF